MMESVASLSNNGDATTCITEVISDNVVSEEQRRSSMDKSARSTLSLHEIRDVIGSASTVVVLFC